MKQNTYVINSLDDLVSLQRQGIITNDHVNLIRNDNVNTKHDLVSGIGEAVTIIIGAIPGNAEEIPWGMRD